MSRDQDVGSVPRGSLLVVEDEPTIADPVARYLRRAYTALAEGTWRARSTDPSGSP